MKRSIIFLQNEIMEYRKPVYNGLAENYDVVVLHSGRSSITANDSYKEIILPKRAVWRFHLQSIFRLLKVVEKFDVVIAMFDLNWPAYIALLYIQKRPKYILWGHRYSSNRLACLLRDLIMRKADRLLMYGNEEVDLMVQRGIDPAKIVMAWNTIDIPNHRDYSSASKNSLLFVGRLQKRKQVDSLINAFEKLQGQISDEISLDIVGSGDCELELKQMVENFNLTEKVRFLGSVHEPVELAKLFSQAYAYVSPGPVGLGVLHSFSYGVPVITLRNVRHGPEVHNLVNEKNGILCEDYPALEQAIYRVCADEVVAKELGRNGYEHYLQKRPVSRMLDGIRIAIEE